MTENVIEISDDEDDGIIYISSDEDSNCLHNGIDIINKVPSFSEDIKKERSLPQCLTEPMTRKCYWETQNVLFSKQKLKIEGIQKRKCFAKFSVKSFKNRNSSLQEVKKPNVHKTEVIDCIDLTDDPMDDSKTKILKENKPLEQISSSVSADNIKKHSFPKIPQVEVSDEVCDSMARNIFERLKKSTCVKDPENSLVLVEKSSNVLKPADQPSSNQNEITSQLNEILKAMPMMKPLKAAEKRVVVSMNDEEDVLPVAKKKRNFMDVFGTSYAKSNKLLSDDFLKCAYDNTTNNSLHSNNVSRHITKSLFLSNNTDDIFSKLHQGTNNYDDLSLNAIPLSLLLPKPIKYRKFEGAIKRADKVYDFSENLSSLIEAGLEGSKLHLNATMQLITSMTTTTCRPDYRFVKEIFERFSSKTSCTNEFKIYRRALLFIHQLHELPSHLQLWDYIESAYFMDMIESHEDDLVIKSAVFDTIIYFVEASIINLNPTAEVNTVRNTLAYKLLSLDKHKGNIKTFFGWLEDSLKSYCELKKDGKWKACDSLYNVIISLQKLLAIALIVTKYQVGNLDRMVADYTFVYNRLNTLEEQELLLETIQSDLILLNLCENLLERFASWTEVQNEDKLISHKNASCSMEKIARFYFQLNVAISPNSWSPNRTDESLPEEVTRNSLERFLHILVLLQRSYFRVREMDQLRNHSNSVTSSLPRTRDCIYIQSSNKYIDQLEARLTQSFPTIIKLPKIQQLFLALRLENLRIF